jgi:hypothetical protein
VRVFGNPERFEAARFKLARQIVRAHCVIGGKDAGAVKHNRLQCDDVQTPPSYGRLRRKAKVKGPDSFR